MILLAPQFSKSPEDKKGVTTQAGLPSCVSTDAGWLKESGLGEPFGKASLANTVSGSSRLVPMIGRDLRGVEGWLPIPYEAWPDEGLERGLPRPFAKKKEKLGEGKFDALIDFKLFCQ